MLHFIVMLNVKLFIHMMCKIVLCNIFHYYAEFRYAECRYAECHLAEYCSAKNITQNNENASGLIN
jgi:hypothetical protein